MEVVQDGKRQVVKTAKKPATVHNECTMPVFVAVYCSKLLGRRKNLVRLEEPLLLRPGDSVEVRRPSKRSTSFGNGTLFFSTNKKNLKETLTREMLEKISHRNVMIETQVFITHEQGFLVGRNAMASSVDAQCKATQGALHKAKLVVADKMATNENRFIREMGMQCAQEPPIVRTATLEEAKQILEERGSKVSLPDTLLEAGQRVSVELLGSGDVGHQHVVPMSLGSHEQRALQLRRSRRQAPLERYLGMQEGELDGKHLPNVSVCFSGGGYRALIATLGATRQMQNSGLIDCLDYFASLSGSCWALGMVYSSGRLPGAIEKIIVSAREKLQRKPTEMALTAPARAWQKVVAKERSEYQLPVSRGIDIYATMLAAQLFSDVLPDGFRYQFSQLAATSRLEQGSWPIPIFTSVFIEPQGYEWMEFTPWEAGGEYMGAFVPVEGFGSHFVEGVLSKRVPEVRLGTIMAVTTSAFCLTLKRLMHEIFLTFDPPEASRTPSGREMPDFASLPLPGEPLDGGEDGLGEDFIIVDHSSPEPEAAAEQGGSSIQRIVERTLNNNSWIGEKYLFKPATFSNFTHGITGCPMKRRTHLQLFDGGNDFCLPLPALLRKAREQHVIINLEMSSPPDIDCAKALHKAVDWALLNGFRLPEIIWEQVELYREETRLVCVFEDPEDGSVPTLIYIALQHNSAFDDVFDPVANAREGGFCSTGNLRFAPAEFDIIADLMAFSMAEADDLIRGAIRSALQKLN